MAVTPVQKPIFAPAIALIDFVIVILASNLAYYLRFFETGLNTHYQILTAGAGVLLVLSLTMTGVYDSWRGRNLLPIIKRYSIGLIMAMAII